MSIINIREYEESVLQSVVYDHVDERFINNENADRNFHLHVRFPDVVVSAVHKKPTTSAIFATLSSRDYINLRRMEEKLTEIINNTPDFRADEEGGKEILSFTSFGRPNSDGTFTTRFDVDTEEDTESYFFEYKKEDEMDAANEEDDVNEITFTNIPTGYRLDVVVLLLVQIDLTRGECNFTSVIEEARVSPPVTSRQKAKRKPTILYKRDPKTKA